MKSLLMFLLLSSCALAQAPAAVAHLSWNASTGGVGGIAGYQIERCSGASCSNFSSLATTPNIVYDDSAVSVGTSYSWRVLAFDTVGTKSGYSNTGTLIVALPPSGPSIPGQFTVSVTISGTASVIPPIPPPVTGWTDQDIGGVGIAGSANANTSSITVSGSGADIWGTSDAFHFLYKPLIGDGQIVARVVSVQNTNAWAKVGAMIRETLTAGSANALIAVTPSNGISFQVRLAAGASSGFTAGGVSTAPYWVKLVRAGNIITGYTSSDGITWKLVSSSTITMAANVYVGLAVTAHDNTKLCTSTFDNVQ